MACRTASKRISQWHKFVKAPFTMTHVYGKKKNLIGLYDLRIWFMVLENIQKLFRMRDPNLFYRYLYVSLDIEPTFLNTRREEIQMCLIFRLIPFLLYGKSGSKYRFTVTLCSE